MTEVPPTPVLPPGIVLRAEDEGLPYREATTKLGWKVLQREVGNRIVTLYWEPGTPPVYWREAIDGEPAAFLVTRRFGYPLRLTSYQEGVMPRKKKNGSRNGTKAPKEVVVTTEGRVSRATINLMTDEQLMTWAKARRRHERYLRKQPDQLARLRALKKAAGVDKCRDGKWLPLATEAKVEKKVKAKATPKTKAAPKAKPTKKNGSPPVAKKANGEKKTNGETPAGGKPISLVRPAPKPSQKKASPRSKKAAAAAGNGGTS